MIKWITAATLALGVIAVVLFQDRLFGAPKGIISVQVRLNNTCALPDRDFVLRNLATGRYASFTEGTATVRALYNTKFKLVLAPKYDDVEFDGTEFFLRADRTVTADCGNSEKERGVMGGLKGQFSN